MVSYVHYFNYIFQNFEKIPHVDSSSVGYYGGSVALADYCPYIQEFTWRSNNVVVRGSHCMYKENNPSKCGNKIVGNIVPVSGREHQIADLLSYFLNLYKLRNFARPQARLNRSNSDPVRTALSAKQII
jgi:hypothetical protein